MPLNTDLKLFVFLYLTCCYGSIFSTKVHYPQISGVVIPMPELVPARMEPQPPDSCSLFSKIKSIDSMVGVRSNQLILSPKQPLTRLSQIAPCDNSFKLHIRKFRYRLWNSYIEGLTLQRAATGHEVKSPAILSASSTGKATRIAESPVCGEISVGSSPEKLSALRAVVGTAAGQTDNAAAKKISNQFKDAFRDHMIGGVQGNQVLKPFLFWAAYYISRPTITLTLLRPKYISLLNMGLTSYERSTHADPSLQSSLAQAGIGITKVSPYFVYKADNTMTSKYGCMAEEAGLITPPPES